MNQLTLRKSQPAKILKKYEKTSKILIFARVMRKDLLELTDTYRQAGDAILVAIAWNIDEYLPAREG